MFFLSLFILGFTSLVSQIVMTRELVVSFYGNEFFIGWLLFGWLFWVGVGSIIIKFLSKPHRGLSLVLTCHLLAAVLVPLTIFWIRLSKSFSANAAGQIPDLMPALMTSFIVIAPLCLVLGMHFVAASGYRQACRESQDRAGVLRIAYFYEALGFVLGGLVFSYGLVFLNEFQTSAIVIFLNLGMVLMFLFLEKVAAKKYFLIAAVLTFCLGHICFLFSDQLNIRTAGFRFAQQPLIKTQNSIYGNLALTRTGDQFNFYESGLPVGTDRDEAFNECLIHFPMLSNANPQKVLLIGSGFNGALREILKYNPKEIFYAELDPSIIDLAREYIPASRRILDGGRVQLIKRDPRISLRSLPRDLDVIIINLPNPSTGLINRYFTDEFFKEVRGHLKSNGVMATHLVFASDSVSEPLGNLGTSIYKTIHRNFDSVVILPEDVLFILASPSPLPRDPQVLIQRLKSRNIQNYFVTPPSIVYRYTTDRVSKTLDLFLSNTTARINSDLYPQGYFYNSVYWLSIFHQYFAVLYASVMQTNYFLILVLAVLFILLLSRISSQLNVNKTIIIFAMAMGGFSLMSAEVIVIYGFQIFYGNLYYKISWIISSFMAATAAGAFWGNRDSIASFIKLFKLHSAIGAYFVLWFLVMWLAAGVKWAPPPEVWIMLGAGIGVLIGLEFSCINILYFLKEKYEGQFRLGAIYAADLLGSCLGALGISVFMIPAYGIYKTLLFLMIVNAALAFVLFKKT
ncbi:MAG: hypothetical protein HQL14_01910 [Candidatus Omnitrophica bacterium]|nr:hypothetical protein [Candidatus Omnitrophota bacterium]